MRLAPFALRGTARSWTRRCASAGLTVLAPLLLVATAACDTEPAPPPVAPFDQARAWRDLETIVSFGNRASGQPGNAALRQFLVDELTSAGLTPQREAFTSQTPIGPIDFENVYVDVPSANPAAPIVVLCTHFDTKRTDFVFEGANDGGSGTTVLLELARNLAAGPPRPVRYRILFIDGEEAVEWNWVDPDNRYGSRHHVAELRRQGLIDQIGACVLLDLVGDKDLRFFSESYSDRKLLDIFFASARRQGLGRHVGGPSEPIKDDHLSFLAADIPSVDLIDLDFGPRNSYWHSPEDKLENCSAASLGVTAKIVWGGLPELETWVLR